MLRLLFLLTFFSNLVIAQRVKLISGTLQGLKAENAYNIIFRYDSMILGDETPEKTYLREKKKVWEEQEPGKGSDFVQMWFEDRIERYEPEFIRAFEQYAKISIEENTKTKYTLIVKTTRTEGGWSAGIMNHPGEIDGEVWIAPTDDRSEVLARIGFYKIIGKEFYGGDFEMTQRIQSAYAMAGKGVGDFLKRKSK